MGLMGLSATPTTGSWTWWAWSTTVIGPVCGLFGLVRHATDWIVDLLGLVHHATDWIVGFVGTCPPRHRLDRGFN